MTSEQMINKAEQVSVEFISKRFAGLEIPEGVSAAAVVVVMLKAAEATDKAHALSLQAEWMQMVRAA